MSFVADRATSRLQDLDPVRRNSNVKESREDHGRLLKTLILFLLSSQNAMVSFKELCGLTPAANMKQCILTVSTWLMNSERSLRVTVDLSEAYPTMEAQGPVPELLRKVLNAYDMVTNRASHLLCPTCPLSDLRSERCIFQSPRGGWTIVRPHSSAPPTAAWWHHQGGLGQK